MRAGRRGDGAGVHCIHRGDGPVPCQPLLVHAVFPNAAEPGPQHHVWDHAGNPHTSHGQFQPSGPSPDSSHWWCKQIDTTSHSALYYRHLSLLFQRTFVQVYFLNDIFWRFKYKYSAYVRIFWCLCTVVSSHGSDDTVCLLFCFLVSSCALGFLIGLLFTQRSGNYFVTMFDDYSATLPLVIVVIFETFSVAWVYGTDR